MILPLVHDVKRNVRQKGLTILFSSEPEVLSLNALLVGSKPKRIELQALVMQAAC